MHVRNPQRRLIILAAAVVLIGGAGHQLLRWGWPSGRTAAYELGDSGSLEANGMSEKRAIGSLVDGEDPVAVSAWAHGICRTVTIGEAAKYLGVKATMSSVLDVLTDSLPESTRDMARQICEAQLAANSREKK